MARFAHQRVGLGLPSVPRHLNGTVEDSDTTIFRIGGSGSIKDINAGSGVNSLILSNIGVSPGFSSIYTSNSAQHTAVVQVNLKEGHKVGSYDYINRVREQMRRARTDV